ncbi:diptericin A [Schistocerca americana]|uniref:diptericin A n=1 Tax=Schistocerca americana TaxID=7009 RepID=UPI001F4FD4C2|nr:diptericin A [Schistocerca americana]
MKVAVVIVVCAVALSSAYPSPADEEDRGGIDVNVHREKGVGTVLDAQGQGNIFRSDDGKTRVDVQGQYERVIRGPARHSKPNFSGGITFSHRF